MEPIPYYAAHTTQFQQSHQQKSSSNSLLQELSQQYDAEATREHDLCDKPYQPNFAASDLGGAATESALPKIVISSASALNQVISEEDDMVTDSDQQVVEFDNPYAISYIQDEEDENRDDDGGLISSQSHRSEPGSSKNLPNEQMNYLKYKSDIQGKNTLEPPQNSTNKLGRSSVNEGDRTTSQNSPSCYHAVIAAASTHLYRSSNCSTYQADKFDADDESEHQRDSYLHLMQSQSTIIQKPSNKIPKVGELVLLAKSPSEQMMSISEEQSTRKQHKKQGSLPEFKLFNGEVVQGSGNMKSEIGVNGDAQKYCSHSDQDKLANGEQQNNTVIKRGSSETQSESQREEIQADSLQVNTDREMVQEQPAMAVSESGARAGTGNGGDNDGDAATSNAAYQDSLDSMTPRSGQQHLPSGRQAMTPVIESSGRSKDQYDPTNVSHKQYFMPQAYPPASLKKSHQLSKSPISDNSGINEHPISQPVSHIKPLAMTPSGINDQQYNQQHQMQVEDDIMRISNQEQLHSEHSPSFRQQTFKPIELQKYIENDNSQKQKVLDRYEGEEAGDDTSYDMSQNNQKSVQELHDRNNELQTRIGNLEQILMARLAAQKNGGGDQQEIREFDTAAQQAQTLPLDEVQLQEKSLHQSQSQTSSQRLSYVNTDDQNTNMRMSTNEDKSVSAHDHAISQRFNEEPALGHQSQEQLLLAGGSRQGLSSHRSAAELVKMHHQQFQTQQQSQQQYMQQIHQHSLCSKQNAGGSYVLTTEEQSQRPSMHILSGRDDAYKSSGRGSVTLNEDGQDLKTQMNAILEDLGNQERSMLLETEAEDQQNAENRQEIANSSNIQTVNCTVDETWVGAKVPKHVVDSTEWHRHEQKTSLLRFLENQNAEALRAIQHENSTFIEQCKMQQDRDGSFFSADLKQTQQELKNNLDPYPLSEFQTTTIHEVNGDGSLADEPRFVDTESKQYPNQSIINKDNCESYQTLLELNEALSEENERLRDHMESMIRMVQQFDIERTRLVEQNNSKIDKLEQQVEFLRKENESAQVSQTRDHEETIKSLQAHIKNLERATFQNELQSVNVSCNLSQSAAVKNQNGPQSHQMSIGSTSAIIPSTNRQDQEWQKRVSALEQELKETKDYYLQRLEAAEKTGTIAEESSVLVAGESLVRPQSALERSHTQAFRQAYQRHCEQVQSVGSSAEQDMMRSQADRDKLYEKLALAEQVLEQITEELAVLSGENKFLAKLNQRLTYHACRQEKYFMDFRKQSHLHLRSSRQSQQSSFAASQSIISPHEVQEVVLEKDISKERVSQVVSEAESMLRSERRPRPVEKRKPRKTTQAVIEEKQGLQECLEGLEIVRVFIQQNPVQFADQVQIQQRQEKSSYLKVEQFEKILTNMSAPVSRIEMRRLFNYIFTGMQDPSDPAPGSAKRYLSIADLCKVIDQGKSESKPIDAAQNLPRSIEKQHHGYHQDEVILEKPKRKHHDAIMKAEDLKRQTATIESSEAATYGERSRVLAESSVIFEPAQPNKLITLQQNQLNEKDTLQRRTSAFEDQGSLMVSKSPLNALQANSIIQLEDQLRQQELLNEAQQKQKKLRTFDGARQIRNKEDESSRNPPLQLHAVTQDATAARVAPAQSSNKVEQLKKRIERLSRQARKSVRQNANEEKINSQTLAVNAIRAPSGLDLNMSISEDRATQTISNSNQYKRGTRGGSRETVPASAEMNSAQQPCN